MRADSGGAESGCSAAFCVTWPTDVGKRFFTDGCVLLGFTGWVLVGVLFLSVG